MRGLICMSHSELTRLEILQPPWQTSYHRTADIIIGY
jgi:hypothetical protein